MKRIMCLLLFITMVFSNGVSALEIEKISSVETIASQSVQGEDVIAPYHVTGEALVQLIKKMANFDVPGSKVIFNRKSAQLFVRNTPSNHDVIGQVISDLRSSNKKQIEIEARIISVSSTDIDDLGLDVLSLSSEEGGNNASAAYSEPGWATKTGSEATKINFPDITSENKGANFSFAALGSDIDLEAYIDALKSRAEVNTLSAPRLMVANNQRANIKIEKAQYFVKSIQTDVSTTSVASDAEIAVAQSGTILDVTPSINSDGTITLEMHPQFVTVDLTNTQEIEISSGISNPPSVTLPVYKVQQADTTILIQNGGVAAIGGLIEEAETKGNYKVPVLGDMPLLGNLFSRNQVQEIKTHLVIFVKATVRDTNVSM